MHGFDFYDKTRKQYARNEKFYGYKKLIEKKHALMGKAKKDRAKITLIKEQIEALYKDLYTYGG